MQWSLIVLGPTSNIRKCGWWPLGLLVSLNENVGVRGHLLVLPITCCESCGGIITFVCATVPSLVTFPCHKFRCNDAGERPGTESSMWWIQEAARQSHGFFTNSFPASGPLHLQFPLLERYSGSLSTA